MADDKNVNKRSSGKKPEDTRPPNESNVDESMIDQNVDPTDFAANHSSEVEDMDLDQIDLMHDNAGGGMKDMLDDSKGKDKGDKNKKGGSSDVDDLPFSKGSDSKPKNKKNDLMKKVLKAKAGSSAAGGGALAYTAYKLIEFLKLLFTKAVQMVQGFLATVVNAIMSVVNTVASFLGVSVTIAATIVTGSTLGVVSAIVVGVSTVIATNTARTDAVVSACVPSTVKYENPDLDEINDGEMSQIRKDSAQKIWSVFKKAGATVNVTAGVLGNFDIESSINPKRAEGDYLSPPVGASADSWNDDDWLNIGGAAIYNGRYPNILRRGLGLGQWTDTADGARGNSELRAHAKAIGKPWYSIDAQISFMFNEPNGQRTNALKHLLSDAAKDYGVDEATRYFLIHWEGNPGDKLAQRQQSAAEWAIRLTEMETDDSYADSILNDSNISQGNTNNATGEYNKSDGCDDVVGSHYSGGEPDGTGEVPSDLQGWAWTPATLPDSLKKFAHDPESVGLGYNSSKNWFENSGQCVDFSNSYMSVLYSKSKMTIGNGKDTAYRWADVYGGEVSKTPVSGAVFSCLNAGQYGHTGIVEHVFANGDILVIEQNVPGYSGAGAGQTNSWNWRIITKAEWSRESGTSASWGWVFFKPNETPKWDSVK